MGETPRQLVHLSGGVFILIAQFMQRPAPLFFGVAAVFLIYSLHLTRGGDSFRRLLHAIDVQVRRVMLRFERPGPPFRGAFWFYFSCGLVFLFFPHIIATAASLILAVSDALATIVGYHKGKHRLIGKKTLEGTSVFFVSAVIISFAFFPAKAITAAFAATAGELIPELVPSLRHRGLLDDNLTIPLFAAFVFLF